MSMRYVAKKLYRLTVPQSLFIVLVLSLPLILILMRLPYDYSSAKTIAHVSILYFCIAFILYLFLFAISHLKESSGRKALVMFTRVFIRFHISMAIVGTGLIVLHAALMLTIIPTQSPLLLTGLLTLLGLLGVLITGYLRKIKSSGKRRRYHRYLSFLFILLVIIHILV
jgi:hypothetical protein